MTPTRNKISLAILQAMILGLLGVLGYVTYAHNQVDSEVKILSDVLVRSNAAIVAIDSKGKVVEWSNGATEIFGWTREEVIGEKVDFLIPDSMLSRHHKRLSLAFSKRDGKTRVIECKANHKTLGQSSVDIVGSTRVYGEDMAVSHFELASNVIRVNESEKQ